MKGYKTYRKKFKNGLFILFAISFIGMGCRQDNSFKSDCIRGMYIGEYCEGIVIKILDDHEIGRDWENIFDNSIIYRNSVVASIDTLMVNTTSINSDLLSPDSVFYFKYRDGGYGRKQFNICEPSAFITITYVSNKQCQYDTEN